MGASQSKSESGSTTRRSVSTPSLRAESGDDESASNLRAESGTNSPQVTRPKSAAPKAALRPAARDAFAGTAVSASSNTYIY